MSLRLVFMGTPDFAATALQALLSSSHEVVCVYSQPPRPAGRGHKEQKSPVHRLAEQHSIPVRTPRTLRDTQEQADFAALGADIAVVAAYGLILPRPVLEAPRLGCINIHASLLPRWRGAAPIQRAIMAGDDKSGITIMRMEEGLDTGPMLLREEISLDARTTGGSLHDALAALGGRLILPALDGLAAGSLADVVQPEDGVTYAAKLTRDEARLDWNRSADELERQIRAFAPAPGAWFDYQNERFKVLEAAVEPLSTASSPGKIIDERLGIACNDGVLRITRLQRAGKGPMDADAFLRGFSFPEETVLA